MDRYKNNLTQLKKIYAAKWKTSIHTPQEGRRRRRREKGFTLRVYGGCLWYKQWEWERKLRRATIMIQVIDMAAF